MRGVIFILSGICQLGGAIAIGNDTSWIVGVGVLVVILWGHCIEKKITEENNNE